jgi:hypothetical protein
MTKPADKAPAAESLRRPGLRALALAVPRVTAAAGVKRGFARAAVISHWGEIVGSQLARGSLPERLIFPRGQRNEGTLHIRVDGPLALELQHLEPLVVERINGFFGYRAVARLALRQGPLPRPKVRPKAPPPRALTPTEEKNLAARVAAVADPELRAVLERLGRSLLGESRNPAASRGPGPTGKKP